MDGAPAALHPARLRTLPSAAGPVLPTLVVEAGDRIASNAAPHFGVRPSGWIVWVI